MHGLKLAASYGFYPHQLGFCGVQGNSIKKTLQEYLSGQNASEQKIRKILRTFKGAFSYYQLIAENNNIKDPFDEKVVKAYWIGRKLLEKVPVDSLRNMIVKKFTEPGLLSKRIAEKKARKIPSTAKAHHSFHVLVIGSVSGKVTLKGKLLDLCLIRWGTVIKKAKGKIVLEYQPLQKRKGKYCLGKPIHKIIFWEKKFIPKIKSGDQAVIHWNHIVQILKTRDLNNLKKYTQITIDSLN